MLDSRTNAKREHDDDKLIKCFNKIFVPSKSDEESINTCEMDEEYINATNSDNKWLEEWLIYKGASGNVTYSNDKMTNDKGSNRFIKVRNGDLCDIKCEDNIEFEPHGTGLRFSWHAFSINWLFFEKYLEWKNTSSRWLSDCYREQRPSRCHEEERKEIKKSNCLSDKMKCFIFKVKAQKEKNEISLPKMMDINEADDIWGHKKDLV
jgi:hypothetical protein